MFPRNSFGKFSEQQKRRERKYFMFAKIINIQGNCLKTSENLFCFKLMQICEKRSIRTNKEIGFYCDYPLTLKCYKLLWKRQYFSEKLILVGVHALLYDLSDKPVTSLPNQIFSLNQIMFQFILLTAERNANIETVWLKIINTFSRSRD